MIAHVPAPGTFENLLGQVWHVWPQDHGVAVYAYLWEETSPETLDIRLNGRPVAEGYDSGPRGGAANFSGVEIWQCVPAVLPWRPGQ